MRSRRAFFALLLFGLLGGSSCSDEPEMELLDEYESADLAARAWSFQVYPGATFLPEYTSAYRKSHALLNPESPEPPPIAVYETEAGVEEVARFYAEKYGYENVAEGGGNGEQAPPAYFTSGDLGADTRNIAELLRQLGYKHDVSDIAGTWSGAHVAPTGPYPRVTIQRPYYDFVSDTVRDRTMVLMVRE